MSTTPSVHQQLLEQLQAGLAEGQWQAGERFPSERELASQHNISRATANKVLARLISEGWIVYQKGIGCFVAERPTLFASLRQMESFTAFARAQGFKPSTEVVTFRPPRSVEAPILNALQVTKTVDLRFLQRRRRVNGEVVIFEERWLPAARYPNLQPADLEGSFYELCRKRYELTIEREEAEVRAVHVKEALTGWSGPSLCLTGTGYDDADKPLWFQRLHYRGDRFVLGNTIARQAAFPQFSLQLSSPA